MRLYEAVRDLSTQAVMRTSSPKLLGGMLRRLDQCGVGLDARLTNLAMTASLRGRAPDLALAYFERLTDDLGARMVSVNSLYMPHYYAKTGLYTMLGQAAER